MRAIQAAEELAKVLKQFHPPTPDYQEALKLGEVLVAYARVMMVGPGGVGKSSLLRGLMNQSLLRDAESTILADTKTMKPQFWAKAGESADSYWAEVTDQDEIEELAGLLQLVLAKLHPVKALSISEFNSQGYKPQSVQAVSDEYVSSIKDNEVQSVLRQVAEHSMSHFLPTNRAENLHSEVLMHVWDCGGQPVFLDVLPAFLTSRTMFLLFFDARQNLLDRCSSLSHKVGTVVSKSEQNFTTLQLLTRWMANIHAMYIRKDTIEDPNLEASTTPSEGKSPATQGWKTQTSDPAHGHKGPQISARNQHSFGENTIPKFPRIIPVGTHGDEVQEREKILNTLLSHCEGKAYAPLLLDGVIVDNTTAGYGIEHEDEGFRYIREQVHQLTSEHLAVRTPIAWVLFRKVLQNVARDNPIVSYRQAVAVGQACGIAEDVVPSVLHFYHELAVFLHYVQIKSLSDQVIADPQWLVKQLGRLLAPKGLKQNVSNQLLLKPLHEKGILIQPLYEEVWKKSILKPQSLADLLEYFLLAAPIDPPIAVSEIPGRKYFVPSVLQLSSPWEHRMCNMTTVVKKSSPLHLTFSTKYVPPGFFTRLATTLMRAPKCEPLFEQGVFCNKITFAYDQIDEFTICEMSSSVQINVVRIQHRQSHNMTFGNTCCDIIELIQACSATVCQWLPSVEVKAAFLCEQCPDFITIPHGANTGLNVYCKARHHCNLTREKQYWLKIPSTPEGLAQKGDLSDTELQEVAHDILRDGKLKELAEELEMVPQLQSVQHDVNASLTLLCCWHSEIQNAVEAHSLLVHHLKCIGLTRTSDRLYYREFLSSSRTDPTAENKGTTRGSDRAGEIVASVNSTSKKTRVNPPKIIRHPKNQSVAIGVNVEFCIEATGKNLQFQWQKDGSNLVNSGKYHGIYTDTLHIVAVEGSDEGDYRCSVENDVGRLFSDVALLSFDDYYLRLCKQAMRESGVTDQTIMHCIFVGPAGVGKSTLLKRLLRIRLDQTRTSTQLAENSVRVDIRNVSTHVAQVSDVDWQLMEDPMTQASELIEQLAVQSTKVSTKGNHLAAEGPKQQFSDYTEQVSKQESIPNSPMTTSPVVEEPSKNNTSAREELSKSNTLTKEEPSKSKNPAEKANYSQMSKSPTEESGYPISKSPKSEVSHMSKAIDFFRHVLKKRGVSRMHVVNPCTLYLTDSGGQPEFQELLPALVVGPCVFIIVFPLHKDLNDKYEVEYERPHEDKHMQKYTSSLTIKEDLMRSLASIASIEYKDIHGKEVKSRVMFVATFKDKVSNEECQRKLKILQALIEATDAYHQGMIAYASKTQMVFTIDNASDDEAKKDTMVIRGAIQNLTKFFKASLPYPWLIFSILVQHLVKESVIHKEECNELAQECGIHSDMFEAALQFLHKQTGVLQYYQKPSELNHIVIRDPQHLLSRVSQLVEETFTFEGTQGTQCPEDFKKGIFKSADYKELTKDYSSSLLTPSMLLDLLVQLNVVVPLGDGEKYFMPCAISHIDEASSSCPRQSATNDDISSTQCALSSTIPPLLITFKSGYCPKGLFGALVACIANKEVANCTLSLNESEIYRDQICFRMSQEDLVLKIYPTYIHIELKAANPLFSVKFCTLCNHVRELIEKNITEACKTLNYSKSANYKLSFACQCSQKKEFHLAELRKGIDGKNLLRCKQSKELLHVKPSCCIWLPEPTILEVVPNKQSVATGTKVKFSVKATGDDLCFQWMKDCQDLQDGSKCRGTTTHTLQIKDVEKSDNGSYQCFVKNVVGKEMSEEADLAVIDPPKITQHPKSKSVTTGTPTTTFTVEATGDDLCFQWMKDCQDLRDGSKCHGATTHTLQIKDVEKSDNGSYQCLVKNVVGKEMSEEADLAVIDPPKITQHPKSKSVTTGTPTTTFTVEATGDDLRFQWMKDCQDLRDGSKCHGATTHTLQIKDVEKSDNGSYHCLVKNVVGKEKSEEADLAVITAGHNWTQIICILTLLLLVTMIGMWWLLPSVAVNCGTLPDPANGRVSHTTRTTFGQTATYSCNPDYNLMGDSTHVCQAGGVWSGSEPTYQYGPPTLDHLRHFHVTNGHIDIAVEIGTNYEKFGTLLLEDKKGNGIDSIAKSKHYIPVDITVEILKQWLQGKGRKPVTWQILVKCLRDTNLNALADDIESSLPEHDGSKNSDKAPSGEL